MYVYHSFIRLPSLLLKLLLCVAVSYFRVFSKDALRIKLVVYLVFSLEIAQSICTLVGGFRLFALHWGDPTELNENDLDWLSVIGLGAIGESCFNCRRYTVVSYTFMQSTNRQLH